MYIPGYVVRIALTANLLLLVSVAPVRADDPAAPPQQAAQAGQQTASPPSPITDKLIVTVGKSLTIDSPLPIKRLSAANGALADISPIGPKEVLINGKAPGETSLIIWQEEGPRLIYELTVRPSPTRLNAAREQIARELPDANINITYDNDTAFVRGVVKDVLAAQRVMTIVGTLGKAVNLLNVEVPDVEGQILLHVRFADVDRNAKLDLNGGLASGTFNTSITGPTGALTSIISTAGDIFTLTPNFNLTATLQALQGKNKLQILAEPNLLAINGKQASFNVGGEFPYPTVQSASGGGTPVVTLAFKPYGIILNYMATITPRGTIRVHLSPEVSSLDYTNASNFQGYLIPGTSVRRVETEVELESGQTFIVAGLLDKQTTESLSKVPGISSIPILGALFKSKSVSRNNSELMIIITPELVRPIPVGQPIPSVKFTEPFLPDNSGIPMRHPGMDVTGPVPVHPVNSTLPFEQLVTPRPQNLAPMPGQTGPGTGPGAAPPADPSTGKSTEAPATAPGKERGGAQ